MNDEITYLTKSGDLVVIEGTQYRKATKEEFISFTCFSEFQIAHPETQPPRFSHSRGVDNKLVVKDWKNRSIKALITHDRLAYLLSGKPVYDCDLVTLRYSDDAILHRNGNLYIPITKRIYQKPKVVTLCGSTRFYKQFLEAYYLETMSGKIVLSVGFYPHATSESGHGEGVGHDSEQKEMLDELHKRKIDMSDEVFVLNVGGYIGESTASEIEYAKLAGVPIRYLETPPKDSDACCENENRSMSGGCRNCGDPSF